MRAKRKKSKISLLDGTRSAIALTPPLRNKNQLMILPPTALSLVSPLPHLAPSPRLALFTLKTRDPTNIRRSDMRQLTHPTLAKKKSLLRRRKMTTRVMRMVLKVQLRPVAPVSGKTRSNRNLTAPPAAKKRKTAPTSNKDAPEVSDEEEVDEEEPEIASDEEAVPVENDEDEDGEGESAGEANGVEATAKSGGPAASAKAAKGSVVPKEDDLEEVKGDLE